MRVNDVNALNLALVTAMLLAATHEDDRSCSMQTKVSAFALS